MSEHDYLAEYHPTYPRPDYEALDWMNNNLPAGSKVMVAGDSRTYYTRIAVVPSSIFNTQPIVQAARKAKDGAGMAQLLREQGVTHLLVNFGEAVRTESYGLFPWDTQSWAVLEDFWHKYVRLVWMSAHPPNPYPKALFVYQLQPNTEAPGDPTQAPPNPFEQQFERGNLNPGGGPQQQQAQQQLARMNPASIDNAVVKLAGLILGSPEFQRQ